MTSVSMEISDMIFSIKEKITDLEFKNLMEKLTLVNKLEDNDLYEFKFYKQKVEIKKRTDDSIENVVVLKLKKIDKIKVKFNASCAEDIVIKSIEDGKWNDRFEFNFNNGVLEIYDITGYGNLETSQVVDTEKEGNDNLFINYHSIIPLSLKKL